MSGNYSASAQANITSCCGPTNTPHPYNIPEDPNTPQGCFQMCNITNGTYEELYQNQLLLSTCLGQAGAVGVSCQLQAPPISSGLQRMESSWMTSGVLGLLLVGMML